MKALLLSTLLLTGCVTSSRYEEDQTKLQQQLSETKKSLNDSQQVLCALLGQQCVIAGAIMLANPPEGARMMSPEHLEQFCMAQIGQCLETLKVQPNEGVENE